MEIYLAPAINQRSVKEKEIRVSNEKIAMKVVLKLCGILSLN